MGGGYHSDIGNSADKSNYQPVPDGRFYTKANFFSLADQQQLDKDQMLNQIVNMNDLSSGKNNQFLTA
jgi:hypothetical protein